MLNIGDRYTNKFGEQFEIIKKTSSGYLIKFDNGVLTITIPHNEVKQIENKQIMIE